jgi:glucose-6-phosphate-specific signal transduction histidine kinase
MARGSSQADRSTNDRTLIVEVSDDGLGGADRGSGSGLRGLEDRISALGGSLTVESPPGRGKAMRAEISCFLVVAAIEQRPKDSRTSILGYCLDA